MGLLGASGAQNKQVVGVWWGGIADAVAGTPPVHWLKQVETLFTILLDRGVHVIAVLPPDLPFVESFNGYDKSSRRWMRRVREPFAKLCSECGITTIDSRETIDDDMWRDPFTLTPKGYSHLADKVSTAIQQSPVGAHWLC
jgi:hypothetical protein